MFSIKRKQNTDDDRPSMCRYCENASPLHDEDEMLCRIRGVVSGDHVCRKFIYDPLKRRPMTRRKLPSLELPDDDITEKDNK